MGRARRSRATALALALAALACGTGEPRREPPPPAEATGAAESPVAAPPAAEATAPAAEGPAAERAVAEAFAVPADAEPAEPPERVVPLEALLRTPSAKPPPAPLDLRAPAPTESGAVPADRGVTDAVRERVRVDRRSEAIGQPGPDQGTYSETDASVDVPVGERVKLRGGVRVEERDQPAEERRERESTPRVGVEVQF